MHMKTIPVGMGGIVLCLFLATPGPSRAALTHRYSFTADAKDSVGTAHGTLEGAAAVADGAVSLDGTAGTYVNLPGGLISGYSAVTFEFWASLIDNGNWPRVFDIGGTNAGNGHHYIFFTGHSGASDSRLAISDADPGYNHEQLVTTAGFLDNGSPTHVVGVLNPAQGWGALYINGILEASSANITIPLSQVATNYAFLGKSLYTADPYFIGSIDEFRIYDSALSSPEIAASFAAGPNSLSTDAGTLSELTMVLPPQIRQSTVAVPQLGGTFSKAGTIPLLATDVTLTSSDPGVVEVRSNGTLYGRKVGTATLTAQLGGRSAAATLIVEPAEVVLVNRYSFNEAAGATVVVDSVSGANGTAYPAAEGANTVTFGNGQATFPGGAGYRQGAYIDLPDGLISSKQNVTIELWGTWNGPAGTYWQRFFDFGASSKGDSPFNAGDGTGSFFLTPLGGGGVVRFDAAPTGFAGEQILDGTAVLPIGQEQHMVCIYAPDYALCQFWLNGRLLRSGTTPFSLSSLNDVNNWLGLSNWNDPPFSGSINEFRIYEGALDELGIALRRQAGPNTLPTEPGLLKSLRLSVPPLLMGNTVATPVALLATFEKMTDLDVTALSTARFSTEDTNVISIATAGTLLPVSVGSAQLVGSYEGLTATGTVNVLAPTALRLTVPSPLAPGAALSNAVLTAEFTGTNANVAAFAGVTFISSEPSVATVNATGGILPLRVGTTTLSATYGGLSATAVVEVRIPAGQEAVQLVHRYSFSEAAGATTVKDSVGNADGTLVNPSATSDFTGTGRLKLEGGAYNSAGGYVNLPNGLVSQMTNLSLEGWVKWSGPAGSSWQRIFDFGRNAAVDAGGNFVEDEYANPGIGYMFLTPRSGNNTFRFAIKRGQEAEAPVLDAAPLPVDQDVHFVVAYDAAAGAVRLYRDGVRVQTGGVTYPLSVVEDLNVYLGRSQWTDPLFAGEFDEFRIYRGALSDAQVAASYAAGPNALPDVTPAPTLTISAAGGTYVLAWPSDATGFTLQSSAALGPNAQWSAATETVTTEGGQNKAVLQPVGSAKFYRLIK
jgi:hypothetical protein